jgi:hypothetical protein
MATKKKAPAKKKRAPKPVPGTPREHRMIDAREEREQVKRLPRKGPLQ